MAEEEANETTQDTEAKGGGLKAILAKLNPLSYLPKKDKEALEEGVKKAEADIKEGEENLYKKLSSNKKLALIAVGATILVIVVAIVLVMMLKGNKKKEVKEPTKEEQALALQKKKAAQMAAAEQNAHENAVRLEEMVFQKIGNKKTVLHTSNSQLTGMITKAQLLYETGARLQAIDILDEVAVFSKSLASYNLGVIYMKEKNYDKAIASFKSAISDGDDISVSAINIMASMYKKGSHPSSVIAETSEVNLSKIITAPVYSYAYALNKYYNNKYFETLSPLINATSENFNAPRYRMLANMYVLFNDPRNALKYLNMVKNDNDYLAIGKLHARLGEYEKAREAFLAYMKTHPQNFEVRIATEILDLKDSNYKAAAAFLQDITNSSKATRYAQQNYPIKIMLRPSLFNVHIQQEDFWHRAVTGSELSYSLLFYYAPFRVFNAENALNIISDGALRAHFGNIQEAKDILEVGDKVSAMNLTILDSLRQLASHDIRDALKIMKTLSDNNVNHPSLHYNLGLIYAQMERYEEAYKHFIRAYHLAPNDFLSAAFAVVSARLAYMDTGKLLENISRDFNNSDFKGTEREFMRSLLFYLNGNLADDLAWINRGLKTPIYFALKAVFDIGNNKPKALVDDFKILLELRPKDVVTDIMYVYAKNYKDGLKNASLEIQTIFRNNELSLNTVLFGPSFGRYIYVYSAFLSGTLSRVEQKLNERLIATGQNANGIMQALALAHLYNKKFAMSFSIYNDLIDNLHEDDERTKFFAAVAAIGARDLDNAVPLLQISKMQSKSNLETRLALALIYQEKNRYSEAGKLLSIIGERDFRSHYFDFYIDDTRYKKALEGNAHDTKKI